MADIPTKIIISAQDTTGAAIASAKAGLEGLGRSASSINAMMASIGVGVSLVGFAAMVKSTIDAADALNDLSQKLGISVKELGKYELAAKQSGTSLEAIGKGVKGLAVNMAEHGEALAKAGITAKTADGALRQLADVFAKMPDSMEKSALAVALFGKSGMDMIPMLNLGSKGLAEAAEKSAKYAAAMAVLAPQADKFNDSMTEIAMSSRVMGISLANQAMPALLNISAAMAQAAQESGWLMAAWVGLGGLGWELIFKPAKVIFLGINNDLDELNAKLMRFFGQAAEASKLDATIARRWKEIADMTSDSSAPAKADIKPPKLDTTAWTKAYKEIMAAMGKGAADAAQAGVDEFAALMNKINAKDVGLDPSYWKDLETLNQGYKAGRVTVEDYAAAVGKLTSQQKFYQDELKKSADVLEELRKVENQRLQDSFKSLDTIAADITKQREHNEEIGRSVEALNALRDSREGAAIAAKEQELAGARLSSQGAAEIDVIEQQIEAMKTLRSLRSDGAVKQVAADAAKQAAEDWKRSSEDIERALTDSIMRGGKNGLDYLKDYARTLVLRPIIQAVMAPVAGAVASAFGSPLASAGSSISGMSGLYNAGATMFGTPAAGASLAGSSGLYGNFAASSIGQTLGLSAATTTAEGVGITSMTALGAAMPYIAAAVLAYEMLHKDSTPTSNLGERSMNFSASGDILAQSSRFAGPQPSADAAVQSMETAYLKAAMSLGIGTVASTFAFASNTGENGQHPNFGLTGSAGGSTFTQAETGTSDAAIQLAASRAVFAALQGSTLPGYLAKVFDGLSAGAMTQEQINNTEAFAQSLKSVREALTETREPLQILQDNVAQATAALQTSATTFKTDFVAAIDAGITPDKLAQWQGLQTAMDQLAQASGTAAASVGAVSKSLADISSERKQIQDQIDNLTMTSTQLLDKQRAALDASNVSKFDELQADIAAKAALDAAAQSAKDAAAAETQLAQTRKSWQTQLDVLSGTLTQTEADRNAQLAENSDAATQAIMRQVFAMQDQAIAANNAVAAMQKITASMDQLAAFKGSVGGSIQSVRAAAPGFDAVAYQAAQVDQARKALGSALGIDEQMAAGTKLQTSIMARYQAETDAANKLHTIQDDASRAAIDAANQLNTAYRNIGDYAQSLLFGNLSALSPEQKLAAASSQFQDMLGRARGGDLGALSGINGVASNFLDLKRQSSDTASGAYVSTFNSVQTALAALGAKAGPDQVYQDNTAAWQASLLTIQSHAIDELTSLSTQTDTWQNQLQANLNSQAVAFSRLNQSNEQIAENTKDLAPQIKAAIAEAFKAGQALAAALAEAQAKANDAAIEKQTQSIEKLPAAIASATVSTDRRG